MGGLFGGSQPETQAASQPAASGIKFQSSVYGKVITCLWGTDRLPVNVIGYGNFKATAHTSAAAQPSGGKGGMYGDQAQVTTGSTYYTYNVGIIVGLCEGPVSNLEQVWNSKSKKVAPTTQGWSVFFGSYPQAPFSNRALILAAMGTDGQGYNGLAYMASHNFYLGQNATLPNINVEVKGLLTTGQIAVGAGSDPAPALIIKDVITNLKYGLGLPAAFVGPTLNYVNYTLTAGIRMTYTLAEQKAAADVINEVLALTNTDATISEGVLKFIPRGDTNVTNTKAGGTSLTYLAPTILFNLGDDDLLPFESGDLVEIVRKDPADLVNVVTLECVDRDTEYAPAIVRATDDALVAYYGVRADEVRQAKCYKRPEYAAIVAQLLLQRQSIMNMFRFRLPPQWVRLDPGDVVTITDAQLGLTLQPVKIVDMNEGEGGVWDIEAEEYGVGFGTAGDDTTSQSGGGDIPDFNVDPGDVDSYAVFELPAQFTAGRLEVSVACAGLDDNYGGCEVWVANDDINFSYQGRVFGSGRIGKLDAQLANITPEGGSTTEDNSNTLAVDLNESGGELASVSQNDYVSLNSACYVGTTPAGGPGELVGYRNALLLSTGRYALTTLLRGAYATTISQHAANSKFVRLDSGVVQVPYPAERIGQTIHIKLLAFNKYGAGLQLLADVASFSYVVLGTAYSAPTDVPVNTQQTDIQNLYALLGAMQLEMGQQANKTFLLEASGNFFGDSFTNDQGLDIVNSVNTVLNRSGGHISPFIATAAKIDRTLGTIIGNFVDSHVAFDVDATKAYNLCAKRTGLLADSGEASFLGKDYGVSPKAIQKIVFKGSIDRGFGPQLLLANSDFAPTKVSLRIYGVQANGVYSNQPTAGQPLANYLQLMSPKTGTNVLAKYSTAGGSTVNTFDSKNLYRYVWGTVTLTDGAPANTGSVFINELEIYQASTPGNMKAISKMLVPAVTVAKAALLSIMELVDPTVIIGTELVFDVAANAYPMTITTITRANPAVVSVTPAHAVSAGLANGQNVYITLPAAAGGAAATAGMTQVNGNNYTVANYNAGAGTFELSGIDSSAFTAWAGTGRALRATWNRMPVGDITGAAGGKFRTLQSVFKDIALADAGYNLAWLASNINGKLYKLHGVQLAWK